MKRLTEKQIIQLSDFYKVFGDSTRIKILLALEESAQSVSMLVEKLNMSQSAVSHQLQVLRRERVVKFHRDGKNVIYSLDDEHVSSTLIQGIEHIQHGR